MLRRVALAALLVLSSGVARANGRFPASSAVVLAPGEGDTILVRATFGLLVSRDHGATFGFVCERAVGFAGIEDPSYLVTTTGAIVAATYEGVSVTRDRGCEWAFAGGAGKFVFVDLTRHADGAMHAIHSLYARTTDAGIRYENSLWVSRDDAASFTVVGAPIDPTLLLETVDVAPSDAKRIYVTGVRGEGSDRVGVMLVSRDAGATFRERVIPLASGERAPFIGGVDEARADRVYVRTAGDPAGPSRLLVTDDAGATFRIALEAKAPLRGFALSPDGATVFAGSRDGLFVATASDLAFASASPGVELQCLAAGANVLWACSNERSGFFAASSRDRGVTFDRKLHLQDLAGPLACAASTTVGRICTPEWARVRRELGITDDMRDAGAAPGPPPPPVRPEPGASAWSWLALVAAIASAAALIAWKRRRQP